MSGKGEPLFASGAVLIAAVTGLLADRQDVGQARRATTTPEALSRWLPSAMIQVLGGDVVAAAVVTGRVDVNSRTPIHYGGVSQAVIFADTGTRFGRSTDRRMNDMPGQLVDKIAGDRLTPSDKAVNALIDRLASDLRHADDLAGRHAAMTRYTVALLAFAFAHRGDTGTLPSASDVDHETRFVWIDDKRVANRPTRRLVWVCDTAIEQLRRFETHLDIVQGHRRSRSRREGRRAAPLVGLTLFDMTHGLCGALSVPAAIGEAIGSSGPLPVNAGRHWLRAKLVNTCSTETLHAMLGHGPVEDASWDRAAGLDPFVYRADLARALDRTLGRIGWLPRWPGVMKHWSPETWIGCAEAAPDSATPDHRMGEMLWSAITRGALLDPRWWPSWIRAVQTAADFLPGLISVDMEPDQGTPSSLGDGSPTR